jgi:deoxycytidylate deaminase
LLLNSSKIKAIIVATAKKAANDPAPEKDLFTGKSTSDVIASTHTDELVIALCGPIGSPIHQVGEKIKEMLQETFAYDECTVIRLSSFIEDHANRSIPNIPISTSSQFDRIQDLISHGDKMRKEFGATVLAELTVNQIRLDREIKGKDLVTGQFTSRRICHIIDSVKNQEELNLLRTVYREMLYVVGVFSPVAIREQNLKRRGIDQSQIYKLMDRDSGEETAEGQTVAKTFSECDFFLRMEANTDAQLRTRVERFLHLILGTKIITPTRAETAMYSAASAAGNSACLSRQVGAAVTDVEGELLSVGWNDVPKPFGGLYLTDSEKDPNGEKDMRCWNRDGGKCSNDEEKAILATQIIDSLASFINPDQRANAIEAVSRDKKLRGLIEFSRSIHAEMHAILTALKSTGDRVKGGVLYVTTYPCHSCARHIVASGIKEVYYIEPYKKSLATKLHDDAVSETEADTNKVRILPYDGVAPAKYLSLFRMASDSRKQNGKVIRISPKDGVPRLEKSLEALPSLEALVVNSLKIKRLVNFSSANLESNHGPTTT